MMAPSKSPSNSPNFLITGADETDNFSPLNAGTVKSQCSSLSDGESYECFGENVDPNSEGVELVLGPHNSTMIGHDEDSTISRNAWSRTSLRRVPISKNQSLPNKRWGSLRHSGKRQIGSNALASQLYRSSSFNSSGRSSNCDNTEDMYSDVSLEDVQDLNNKLEILQRQVTTLADSQNTVDDKTKYGVLQARYHMLEEQLRDTELRYEDKLFEEQKRHKDLLARVEREAQLQNENCIIRLKTITLEANSLKDEVQRLRIQCDKQLVDLHSNEEKLEIAQENMLILQNDLMVAQSNENRLNIEKKNSEELMLDLGKEIERWKALNGPALPTTSPETLRLDELHQELEELRERNKSLEESNLELQATVLTRGVEEGRNLLNGPSNSLAEELQQMNNTQESTDFKMMSSLAQLQSAYHEEKDENMRLKKYIDTILLNIVENYPQLLEVKCIDK